jgi:alkanesulfonate monooxygenase SsuD/methylene tetrahydromethanopterin reductase-like flavin-dependent oxidoreductase (luciferase family)
LTPARYGCVLPQDELDVNRIFEVAKHCEGLGYDSIWVSDHLMPYWLASRESLESWTLLAAVAANTSKIRIGTLVTNVNFRNPALLAKMTSTVDNISGGRLIVGLGIGDRLSVRELKSYGYRFPHLEERISLLRETIMILRALWSGKEVSFTGKLTKVSNAICLPKPRQETGPPIWLGGRHRRLLRVIAELADGWNYWGLPVQKLREREEYLLETCSHFNRNRDNIIESWAGTLTISPGNGPKLAESMKAQLMSQIGGETNYFIAAFPARADRKAYEGFAEAVRSIRLE